MSSPDAILLRCKLCENCPAVHYEFHIAIAKKTIPDSSWFILIHPNPSWFIPWFILVKTPALAGLRYSCIIYDIFQPKINLCVVYFVVMNFKIMSSCCLSSSALKQIDKCMIIIYESSLIIRYCSMISHFWVLLLTT